jgi:hypothetical protein
MHYLGLHPGPPGCAICRPAESVHNGPEQRPGSDCGSQRARRPSSVQRTGSDAALVKEARCEEIAFAEQFTHDHELRFGGHDSVGLPISVRELLVHMTGEHARHSAHANLLCDLTGGSASSTRGDGA